MKAALSRWPWLVLWAFLASLEFVVAHAKELVEEKIKGDKDKPKETA